MYEYCEHPYPARNLQLTEADSTLRITWEAPENASPIAYNLYINEELVLENTNDLSYTTDVAAGLTVAKVVALYEDDKTSVSVIGNILIETNTESIEENVTFLGIYPNPVGDILYIETESDIKEIAIYDIYGRQQVTETPSRQVDVADLTSGIYFIKINTEKGNIVKRFIKQ
jgi:hypothetical protein